MKAEQLLVIASARGMRLDLRRPRRDIPWSHRGPPRRRDVVPPTEASAGSEGIPGIISAEGKQTRSAKEAEWGASDLGFACAGMAELHWRTLCWAIGLEEPARAHLKGHLLIMAVELKERDRWLDRVKRGTCAIEVRPGVRCSALRCPDGRYIEDLCELALIEIAEPFIFDADTRRAQFFGVAAHTWQRHLSMPYEELAQRIRSWYASAIGYINSRLAMRENERGAA
jgi:hypothetical protein